MLIAPDPVMQKKIQFRIRMNVKIHDEVMAYCQWAGITYRDFFIEQACKYILENDSEWINYKEGQFTNGAEKQKPTIAQKDKLVTNIIEEK